MVQKAKIFIGQEPPFPTSTPKPYGVDNIGVDSARYMGGSK